MNSILFAIEALWSIRIIRNTLSYVHLWYVKEYRFDRMRIHLKTPQGKRILFPTFKIPPKSPKTVMLFFTSVCLLLTGFIFIQMHSVVKMLLLDVLTFPITASLVLLMRIPTNMYHAYKIRKADILLKTHSQMEIVGITGSYGKTSTKEFLSTILSTQKHVLKTEASKNSLIGISELIIQKLKNNTEAFVVEMGAYKRGEIARMTDFVHPQIGVITAVNAQHQDLFGSIQNTMEAKFELLNGLQGKKIAICNADNEYVAQMAKWGKDKGMQVWSVSAKGMKLPNSDETFIASNINSNLKGLQFTLSWKNKSARISVPIYGVHQALNISLAVAAAVAAGISFADAIEGTKKIIPFQKTMEPIKGIHDSIFINDTFNNNPDAACAAISFLSISKGKKYLVFQPMIELGSYADESHERVAELAGVICDYIILTNNNFYAAFKKGLNNVHADGKAQILDAKSASIFLRKHVKKDDMVLFKGKESEFVLKQLIV